MCSIPVENIIKNVPGRVPLAWGLVTDDKTKRGEITGCE